MLRGMGAVLFVFDQAANVILSLGAKYRRALVQLPPSIILERGLYPVVSWDRPALAVEALS